MQVNLTPCLDLIITENEGGYVDHPDDPGGPTNMGITLATLSAWRKRTCTADDVKALERSEAEAIMASEYAAPVKFSVLPSGLDYCVLDCSVNSGPHEAAKLLQSLLGVDADGIIGAKTLDALGTPSPGRLVTLIDGYCEARMDFMRSLKNWGTFGHGWATRVGRVQARAEKLAKGVVPAAVSTGAAPQDYVHEDAGVAKAAGPKKLTATEHGRHAIAVLASAVVGAGAAATQATQVLLPYANVGMIKWLLTGLAVVIAAGTLVAATEKSLEGG